MAKGNASILQNETVADAAPALAQALGWFSVALGCAELFAGRPLARMLGMKKEIGVVRAYGLREIATGIGILTARDPGPWIWGRVGGDALDLATLARGLRHRNRKRDEVAVAMAVVGGVTLLDLACAAALTAQGDGRGQRTSRRRDYSGRTGFPKGIGQVRGAARGVTLTHPNQTARPQQTGFSGPGGSRLDVGPSV